MMNSQTVNKMNGPGKERSRRMFGANDTSAAGEKHMVIPSDKSRNMVPGGTEFILLIDDEPSLADTYKLILESLGYRVVATTHPAEALEWFRSDPFRFDLVMTDMSMPVMTGKELAVKIMDIRPGIPVVLCTGFCSGEDKMQAETLGIRAVLSKPIFKVDLAAAIRQVLEKTSDESSQAAD